MTIKTPYYIVYEERLRKNLSLSGCQDNNGV